MGKIIHNFRRGPVLRIHELTPDLALTVDSVGIRENKGSENSVAVLRSIADGQEIDLVPRKKSLIGSGVLVHIHAHHNQLRHLLLELVQCGNLLYTRPTSLPRNSAKLPCHGSCLTAGASVIMDSKVRSRLANEAWMVPAVAPGCQQEREQEDGAAGRNATSLTILPSHPHAPTRPSPNPAFASARRNALATLR